MQIRMEDSGNWNTDQIRRFLEGSEGVVFQSQNQGERYEWIQKTLVAQQYAGRSRREKGLVRALLAKMSGLSVPQLTRLIRQYRQHGKIARKPVRRRRFPTKYTAVDIALLAQVDRVHQWLSGPATRRILQREFQIFGRKKFQRLAGLSVSHLYNLRASAAYRRQAAQFTSTQPVRIPIGERRRPDPQGRPGYLRVDTVHQGDWEGRKGVYHLNSVDAVTQWEVVGCAPKISEAYLIPVFTAMLNQYPFLILGLHFDNGSEFINYRMRELL